MKKDIFLLHYLWAFIFVCFAGFPLYGQSGNPSINIQGILRDITGKTLDDGEYSVTFKLYKVKTGGASIWQETADVDISGGIYSHNLGSVTPLNSADFSTTLYLGVRINNFELTPRAELTYSPYTFSVARALKVDCTGAVGDVKYSILDPVKFAEVNGDCWVPMDGGQLDAASRLGQILNVANLPDGGGLAIRSQEFNNGQNNDPDRDYTSPVATLQNDANGSHTHTLQNSGEHRHDFIRHYGCCGPVNGAVLLEWSPGIGDNQSAIQFNDRILAAGEHTHTMGAAGSANVRQKNLNFWVYIRIN